MSSVAGKIIAVLLSVFILAYVGYQAYTSFYDPYESQIVKQESYIQDVALDGFFIRSEKVIETPKEGVVSYRYKNAEKISRSTVVANIYQQESDIYNIERVNELRNEKEILTQSQNRKNIEGLKIDAINANISYSEDSLIKLIDENNISEIPAVLDELQLNMNKLAVIKDPEISFQSRIDDVDRQINEITANISTNNKTVTFAESGYFCNQIDGYEAKFTREMLKDISVSKVKDALAATVADPPNYIGKIQYDPTWSFVALIDAREAELFKEGYTTILSFGSRADKEVTVTIKEVVTEKGNDKGVVVFESDFLNEDFATMRFEKPRAIVKRYSGIVIPKEAVRVERIEETVTNEETGEESIIDGDVKGVYTLLGKTVRFKKLDIVYEDEYYVVSSIKNDSSYVSVYDKVIIKGKDLNATK